MSGLLTWIHVHCVHVLMLDIAQQERETDKAV